MHSPLLAIMQTGLNTTVKSLAAYVYAHSNGTGMVEIPIAPLLEALGIGEQRLRAYRGDLARLGFMQSSQVDGRLLVDLNLEFGSAHVVRGADENAHGARGGDDSAHGARADDAATAHRVRAADESARGVRGDGENAHGARADDDPDRAPHARSGAQRAPGARSAQRGEREEHATGSPHTPPQGISLNQEEAGDPTCLPGASAAATPPPAAACAPDPDQVRKTTGLLRSAGIDSKSALAVAQLRPLADVVRFVAVWQQDLRARRVDGPGALLHRLQDPDWLPPPVADWDAMRYGILPRFVTAEDLEAWYGLHAPGDYRVPAQYAGIVKH